MHLDGASYVLDFSGSVANYVYDADGNRYSAANGGTTTSYAVDTSLPYASVVEEYTGGSATPAARYDYGDDLVRMDRGGVYYSLYDGLGSTRQLVNTGGAVTDTWGYSAFGELASHTGSTVNPFLFNAQQFDTASGDYYLRARYYDQSNGRFVSQDPFEGVENDPISLHRYLYASADPVDRVDPSGRDDLGDLLTSLAITAQLNPTVTVLASGVLIFAASIVAPDAVDAILNTLPPGPLQEGGEEESTIARAIRGLSNYANPKLADDVIIKALNNLIKDHPPTGGAFELTRNAAARALMFSERVADLVVGKKGAEGADIRATLESGDSVLREVFVRNKLAGTSQRILGEEAKQTVGADVRQFFVQVQEPTTAEAAEKEANDALAELSRNDQDARFEVKFVDPQGHTLFSNFSN